MRKRIHRTVLNFRFNAKAFWEFELLSKLTGVAILVPLLYRIFDLTVRVTGYHYLTAENIRRFFLHPAFYLAAFLCLLIVALYASLDMSAVIFIMHCSHLNRKTTLSEAARFGVRNTLSLFKKGNRSVFGSLAVMIPLYCIGEVPVILSTYSVPLFLLEHMRHRGYLVILSLLLLAGLLVLYMRQMFSFHYYSLENADGKEAGRRSLALMGRWHVNLLWFVMVELLITGFYFILLGFSIFIMVLAGYILKPSFLISAVTLTGIKTLIMILVMFFALLGVPGCTVAVSFLFYRKKQEKGEPLTSLSELGLSRKYDISDRQKRSKEAHRVLYGILKVFIFVAAAALCTLYVYRVHRGELNWNIEYLKTMEVTAHRGASRYYPENTMAAFQGALEQEADWIELDVHESSDGQIFVMHDSSFRRTTGKRALAWELTYDEIRQLDAGSFFSEEHKGEPVPLLSEAVAFAKENGIRLNIEIKPSAAEEDLEERLVEILEEEDFIDRCVVTSQKYDSIVKVKMLNSDITTVYVMGLAYGNINRLTYADNFSIRSSFVTDALVGRIHNAGKQVYAWTVNSRDSINNMIDRQVDNIITDNVPLARRCIANKSASDAVNDYISFLNRQLRLLSYRFR